MLDVLVIIFMTFGFMIQKAEINILYLVIGCLVNNHIDTIKLDILKFLSSQIRLLFSCPFISILLSGNTKTN